MASVMALPAEPAEIDALAALIEGAANIVVFTGAGISTESGIPDFRSPGGMWERMAPIPFEDFMHCPEMRRETWRRRFELEDTFGKAKPNRGHAAVAELVKRGKASCVITQNIDNLHQESGVPAERIVELHGNTTYARCLDCGRRYEIAEMRRLFDANGDVPDCSCGGHVKAATISFGQSMPEEAMHHAGAAAKSCDLFLVAGSSLVVYPAAGFPLVAKRHGARLAILNREPTEQDDYADLVIHAGIGEALSGAVERLYGAR
jgi:NAD-dependent deacetylase